MRKLLAGLLLGALLAFPVTAGSQGSAIRAFGPLQLFADDGDQYPSIQIEPVSGAVSTGSGAAAPTVAATLGDSGDFLFENGLRFTSNLVFEGATADGFESTVSVTDPTADNTITIPDISFNLGDRVIVFNPGGLTSAHVDSQIFIADQIYTVTGARVVWGTAESTGDMDVMLERLQGTEACAAGDDLFAAAVDATGTANTVTSPSLTETPANLTLASGDRLCVDLTATPNQVANLVVTVLVRAGG